MWDPAASREEVSASKDSATQDAEGRQTRLRGIPTLRVTHAAPWLGFTRNTTQASAAPWGCQGDSDPATLARSAWSLINSKRIANIIGVLKEAGEAAAAIPLEHRVEIARRRLHEVDLPGQQRVDGRLVVGDGAPLHVTRRACRARGARGRLAP